MSIENKPVFGKLYKRNTSSYFMYFEETEPYLYSCVWFFDIGSGIFTDIGFDYEHEYIISENDPEVPENVRNQYTSPFLYLDIEKWKAGRLI